MLLLFISVESLLHEASNLSCEFFPFTAEFAADILCLFKYNVITSIISPQRFLKQASQHFCLVNALNRKKKEKKEKENLLPLT